MGNKPVITKQQVLDAAFELASTKGLSGLSIREVARSCDVAVGTVYNSYPTKSDLVNDVVGKFWNESLSCFMPLAAANGDFVDLCRDLAAKLSVALEKFRNDWLAEVSTLNTHDLAAAHLREEACFAHIRKGLIYAIERDPRIVKERLEGPLAPEPLCVFVWASMLTSVKRGDFPCETLFELLRRTLY